MDSGHRALLRKGSEKPCQSLVVPPSPELGFKSKSLFSFVFWCFYLTCPSLPVTVSKLATYFSVFPILWACSSWDLWCYSNKKWFHSVNHSFVNQSGVKGFFYSFYRVSSCDLMPGFEFVLFLVDYFWLLVALCVLKQTQRLLLPNLIKSLSAALVYSE